MQPLYIRLQIKGDRGHLLSFRFWPTLAGRVAVSKAHFDQTVLASALMIGEGKAQAPYGGTRRPSGRRGLLEILTSAVRPEHGLKDGGWRWQRRTGQRSSLKKTAPGLEIRWLKVRKHWLNAFCFFSMREHLELSILGFH